MLPIRVLKENASQERGENARLSLFVGAIAIGDLVKSTLGPKGMDKILISGDGEMQNIQVTNDGATILRSIGVDNPSAKVLTSRSRKDKEVGDGTTSVAVFAAELLKEAERLVAMRVHPQVIAAGYRRALGIAQKALLDASHPSGYPLREPPRRPAEDRAHHAGLEDPLAALGALLPAWPSTRSSASKGSANLDAIQIIKKLGGSMDDSYLDEGFLLEKKPGMYQPQRIEKAKILIANTPMDTDKVKVFGSRVRVDSVAKVAEIEAAEREKMKQKVKKICDHGINVFINRQLIYNYPEQLFADEKIMAIEHADFEGIERLALVLGGEIVSTFDSPEKVKFGQCDLIEQVTIGEDTLLRFSGVPLGSAELVSKLRAEHANGKHEFGIDIDSGDVTDVVARGILESYNVKLCMLTSAAEAAEQILRVDDIIKCAPRPRRPDNRPC
ncbi:hypothetical protein M3Y99_00204300 [Aphelenchoides fujianensis]|nr:hypothetical protein M3Y99_00204300 [Aphelenchoides fujianensis]